MLGAGLGGMGISRALSRAGVDHLLVGHRPEPGPRLGESMNVEGTQGLARLFPEALPFTLPKEALTGFYGPHAFRAPLDLAARIYGRALFRMWGEGAPASLVHVDRRCMDPVLWRAVADDAHCTAVEALARTIDYDPASDRVVRIVLDDGTVLLPDRVFDATNHRAAVACAADVEREPLGGPQRVAFAHLDRGPSGDRSCATGGGPAWVHETTLARLDAGRDGIDALAWCIPLGSYASVGGSVDAEPRFGKTELSDDDLITLFLEAFRRRGVDVSSRFPERAPAIGGGNQYGIRSRAHGANWLLVGPAFCSIWYMSGSGVGQGLVAAELAARWLEAPASTGAAYESHMREYLPAHHTLDWFHSVDPDRPSRARFRRQADEVIRTNLHRYAGWRQMTSPWWRAPAALALRRGLGLALSTRGYCDIRRWEPASAAS